MAQVATPAAPVAPCPNCQKPLVDPVGLGWCQSCGYCRSLDEVKGAPRPTEAPAPSAAPLAPPEATFHVPVWALVMIFNVVALAVATVVVSRLVPFKPVERALWTTLQIAGGLFLMLVGQLTGLIRVAPDDPTLSFKDIFLPTRLYGLIVKNLPGTRWSLYLICWGLTLAVSAPLAVGGLGHWMTYMPKQEAKR